MLILVINCGSSSIKYQLLDMDNQSVPARGHLEKVGSHHACLHLEHGALKQSFHKATTDHARGLELVIEKLTDPQVGVIQTINQIDAVGHRVVHGGEKFVDSCLIDQEVLQGIEACRELAPLHNPPNIMGIRACHRMLPHAPQVAVFDTAFHQSMPESHFMYALPYDYYRKHRIRRYGFHGTSHRYVAERAADLLKKNLDQVNLVTCHLGNGCSVAAIRNGKSIDCSMGFTPLEGLVMGTRSGDLDPAIVFYLMEKENITTDQVDDILNKKSGLLGLSGISNDMREIVEAAHGGNGRAQLAMEVFSYRVRKYIGAYFAAVGRLDAVVFTGGIGENSSIIRRMILEGMESLGLVLDDNANQIKTQAEWAISTPGSKVKILVIATNEELLIARDTQQLCLKGKLT